jgi:hypothetical protein
MNLVQLFLLLTSVIESVHEVPSHVPLASDIREEDEECVSDVESVVERVLAKKIAFQKDKPMFDTYFILAGICKLYIFVFMTDLAICAVVITRACLSSL